MNNTDDCAMQQQNDAVLDNTTLPELFATTRSGKSVFFSTYLQHILPMDGYIDASLDEDELPGEKIPKMLTMNRAQITKYRQWLRQMVSASSKGRGVIAHKDNSLTEASQESD